MSADRPAYEAGGQVDVPVAPPSVTPRGQPTWWEEPDPVSLVRDRLGIADGLADVSIAASLAQIASADGDVGRRNAVLGSPLGRFLTTRGGDVDGAIGVVIDIAITARNED
jgi:hypothetical protein